MANNVANVDDVTDAISGVAVGDRAPRKAHRLPTLHTMPTNMIRSHLHRVPEVAAEMTAAAVEDELATEARRATSFAALGRAAVGAGAVTAMAANAFDGHLFVANYAEDAVTVLDGHTLREVSTIAGVPEPYALAVAQGRAFVSAMDCGQDVVAELDSDSVVGSHTLTDAVQDVTVDRDARKVYVARTSATGADVAVIDTAGGQVRSIDLDSRPGEVANTVTLSGDGRTLFVATTDQLGGRLIMISTADLRVFDTLTVVEPIRGFAASHDGATVWVATDDEQAGGLVDALDLRSHRVLGTAAVGSAVRQLMLSAVGDRVYAVTEDAVAVVCTTTHRVVDQIDTDVAPSCVAESADGSRLYVADFDGRITLYSVASATPSLLDRMSTPEALAGPAIRELERV